MEFSVQRTGLEDEMCFVSAICRDNGCILLDVGSSGKRKRLGDPISPTIIRRTPLDEVADMDVAVAPFPYSELVASTRNSWPARRLTSSDMRSMAKSTSS
jgi:hypothetical protein